MSAPWPPQECLHEDTDRLMTWKDGEPKVAAIFCNQCGASLDESGKIVR